MKRSLAFPIWGRDPSNGYARNLATTVTAATGRARPENKKMSGSRPWTPEDEDRLRALAEAKRTLTFAAKELMRTESAVAGQAYKLRRRDVAAVFGP